MGEQVQDNLVYMLYSNTTNIKGLRGSLIYTDNRTIQSAYRLLLISALSSKGWVRVYLEKNQYKLSGKHISIDNVPALKQFIEA